ncbi:hypothetical protein HDV06_002935 [Boothiomyces sp. JEL0866]|nr:hypothetical protein HDV06_002935 [Boothiomyces sp. JEL0866]
MGKLTIVIKLGTSSICDEKTFIPKLSNLSLLVETIAQLREEGHRVVLVSSGAVGMGLRRLKLAKRPKHLSQVQAAAAVGQGRLIALYDSLFAQFHLPIAQILLSRDNLCDRSPYLNACNTLRELLAFNTIPIINENDSVSSSEIRFGDNDSLSAIVAGMVHADYLFLLTDVDSLYTDNPRNNPNAARIKVVKDITVLKEQVKVSSPGSSVGTGGMVTKLIAAELSISAGCNMIITIGSKPNLIGTIIREIQENDNNQEFEPSYGTLFLAREKPMDDRQWWILHSLATAGKLIVDEGASIAISRKSKSSLFAAGIKQVIGNFNALQCVKIVKIAKRVTPDGREEEYEQEIGRGLVNYSSLEIQRILGSHSKDIAEILGYRETEYVISRDNMAIIAQ